MEMKLEIILTSIALRPNALTGVCALAVIMIGAGLLFRQVDGRAGLVWIGVNVTVLLATMVALLVRFPDRDRAIVVVSHAPAQALFTLAEGQSVTIRKTTDSFLLVEASGGRRGWVTPATVERVIPR
jgi:hypothetical protein